MKAERYAHTREHTTDALLMSDVGLPNRVNIG